MANCKKSNIVLNSEKFQSCGDLGVDVHAMLDTDISTLTSLKDFKDITTSELIDVKGWKTMSSYPTLRLLYERYRNSTEFCDTTSSAFNYSDMATFSELVGTYWVDLIEQVIPSTTIWGSTYVYRNTIFDQQKFKYKKSTLLFCDQPPYCGPLPSPTNGCANPNVITTTLPTEIIDPVTTGTTTGTTEQPGGLGPLIGDVPIGRVSTNEPLEEAPCNKVCVKQINCGSEFVGTISIIGDDSYKPACVEPIVAGCDEGTTGTTTGSTTPPNTGTTTGDTTVTECTLTIQSITSTNPTLSATSSGSATVNIQGANGTVTYQWSDGQTTQTAVGLSAGTYTVEVFDSEPENCKAAANVTIDAPVIQIGDCVHGGFVFYLDGNGGGLVCATEDYTGATTTSICKKHRWNGQFPPFSFAGSTSAAIGTGSQNTDNIIAAFQPEDDGNYAAKLAKEFINSGTTATCDDVIYNDWYLPSKDELELMRINLSGVGDLANDFNFIDPSISFGCDGANYWSSTNSSSQWAWAVTMGAPPWGGPFTLQMIKGGIIRPIRSF